MTSQDVYRYAACMIELQRKLLGDSIRNAAFHAALQRVIVPGESTVVDIGAGTGFLSFLALKLGAKHATLIESGEVLQIAKVLAKRNGIRNCTFIQKHSTEVRDIPKADIVLSETLGNFALEENIIESLEDGKRFLKPGGYLIPGKIAQFVSPVTKDRLSKEIDVFSSLGYGLAFDEARDVALNNMYVKTIRTTDLLSADSAQVFDVIDFSKKNASIRESAVRWTADRAVTFFGFALWWTSELVPGVELSTSPFAKPTHWEQIYLPLLKPIALEKGETCELLMHSDSRLEIKINLRWTVRQLDASGKEKTMQKMDMRKGFLN